MTLSPSAEAALIDAVRETASQEILPRFRSLDPGDIATKSRHDDLVTIADREAEQRLTEAARRILPGAIVVGEEAVAEDPDLQNGISDADTCVIIDPIDGTWNFAHGLATFGVILALSSKGRTVWGLIYDPTGDDWVIARAGEGAEFVKSDGSARSLRFDNDPPTKIDAAMGYVHSYLFNGDERHRLFSILPHFHKTDALRCSAHEYRLLAQGAVDFCLSPVLNPWDHAAGCLVAEEAGGVARLLDGTPYAPTSRNGRLLVARSEHAWDEISKPFRAL
ncbi:MAG: inositol monophosphatase family protein [Boseongicola sp.]